MGAWNIFQQLFAMIFDKWVLVIPKQFIAVLSARQRAYVQSGNASILRKYAGQGERVSSTIFTPRRSFASDISTMKNATIHCICTLYPRFVRISTQFAARLCRGSKHATMTLCIADKTSNIKLCWFGSNFVLSLFLQLLNCS